MAAFERYWSRPVDPLLAELRSSRDGLTTEEAARRREQYGPNELRARRDQTKLLVFLSQLRSPITMLLVGCAALSAVLRNSGDAAIILAIVLASALLSAWQEWRAGDALQRLMSLVSAQARVVRNGVETTVSTADVVPGDVLAVSAGATIAADALLLEARDLFVDQATLTGESFPVEKQPNIPGAGDSIAARTNVLFMGTHVVSGIGRAVVAATGRETEFGRISERLRLRPAETEFEHGVRRFGYFLMEVTLLLVLAIFAINVYLQRPALESFVFALALAVGLTPQLLPAIISINLAHGAQRMAQARVIVRRLASLENFGSMTVLCSDKTGTLTEAVVRVIDGLDAGGSRSAKAIERACLNAAFESGYRNPIDEALRQTGSLPSGDWKKLDEIPYDFSRKRLSVLAAGRDGAVLIVKGALANVLSACVQVELADGRAEPLESWRAAIDARFHELSEQGYRVLGVAERPAPVATRITVADERELTFLGFVTLSDTPKPGIDRTLARLREQGVRFKMLTGDNALVARQIAQAVGVANPVVLTGGELRHMTDAALIQACRQVDVFAEVEPAHKERVIRALMKSGEVVGYLGDGVNDAIALVAADVGISVNQAADVAREAADIVLLENDLNALVEGIQAGRATFANTMKYVFMATSANFGNMFSMAVASLFLPFLPLLPKQILLMNLLTDVPEMTIASDRVDAELVARPRRWDVALIRRFMIVFGALSSIFDICTFVAILALLRASEIEFRSAWFVESVISASCAVLVIRTRRPIFVSRPSRPLALATLGVAVVAIGLTWSPLAGALGFAPLSGAYVTAVSLIVVAYLASAELTKRLFYRVHLPPHSRLET